MDYIILALVGLLIGGIVMFLFMRRRINELEYDLYRQTKKSDKPSSNLSSDDYDISDDRSDVCSACDGSGIIETIGGYGNNPIEESKTCPVCGGSG